MNTLLAREAKVNRALCRGRWPSVLAQSQERGGEEVNGLMMGVTWHLVIGGRFVMKHGRRSGGERCSC